MQPDRLLPDVEARLLTYLRGQPLLAGATVVSVRPPRLRSLPVVLLRRSGGQPIELWRTGPVADRAGMAVQVWAGSQAAAFDTARRALAAIYAARADRVVTAVSVLNGLAEVPDPDAPDDLFRYTFAVTVTAR